MCVLFLFLFLSARDLSIVRGNLERGGGVSCRKMSELMLTVLILG